MKKRFTLLLCSLFLCTALGWGQTWQLTPTMTATLDGNELLGTTLTISGTGDMPDYASPMAPWFDRSATIQYLTIEEGITRIGNLAFPQCALTSVSIPSSVKSIGEGAFYRCSGLSSISISSSVKSIESMAFRECGLTSVVIPNSVTSIGDSAFQSCSHLQSVSIPSSITRISDNMFEGCSSLTSVVIPSSVTSIGDQAFVNCRGLKDVTVHWATPLAIPRDVFYGVDKAAATLHVPPGTGKLYAAANVWKEFLLDDPTIVADETEPVINNNTGFIEISFKIPTNSSVTGKINIELPAGMSLDEENTHLVEILASNFELVFRLLGNNTWQIEIKIKSSTLRSAPADFTKIMEVAYKVDESVADGNYSIQLKDIDLALKESDGTTSTIRKDAIPVPVEVMRAPKLSASATSLAFAAAKESKTFQITSNLGWTISSDASWLTIPSPSGTNSRAVVVTAATNTSASVRTATVTVSGTGVSPQVITVTQAGASGPILAVPASLEFTAANSQQALEVASNGNWAVSGSASWLTLSPASGAGDGAVSVTVAANTSRTSARTATLTVTGGGITRTVNITQANQIDVMAINLNQTTLPGKVGGTAVLSVTVTPYNATYRTATWSTSNPLVAAVDSGKVTFTGVGTAVISATVGSFTATCQVTVSTATSTEEAEAANIKVYLHNHILYVSSPAAERVEVYTFSGARILNVRKEAGETTFPVPVNHEAVIVHGSSGWTLKAINN